MRRDKCAKRKCGWVGTDDEKTPVKNNRYKNLEVLDLKCPKCGGKAFYPGEESL